MNTENNYLMVLILLYLHRPPHMASLPVPVPATPKKTPKPQETPNPLKNPKLLKNPQNPHLHLHLRKLSALCKDGLLHDAFDLVSQAERKNGAGAGAVGPEAYAELLQGCVHAGMLREGRQVHAGLIKRGPYFCRHEYICTKLVVFYAKCGCVGDAERVFLPLPRKNAFAWAAVIGLWSRVGLCARALAGLCEMLEGGILPDNFVVPNVLKACSALRLVGAGKAVHGYAWKAGIGDCVYVMSSLVDFYAKCGALWDARSVFDAMAERNVVSWNSMLVGYIHNRMIDEAVELFYDMRIEGVLPTRVTVASFLSASANLAAVDGGRQGHAVAVSSGLELDNILGSSIINFYCKVGLVDAAEAVFQQMARRDVVTWNLMIAGYLQDGQIDKALHTCRQMLEANLRFDCVTLASVIVACVESCNVVLGRAGHGYAVRNSLESDIAVASGLIDLYASCGRMEDACRVSDVASHGDVAFWNAMISAYADHGMSAEALKIFYQMQLEGVQPNAASWNSLISGSIQNGQFDEAQDMFLQMLLTKTRPNLSTRSMLINAFAQNGLHYAAMNLYCKMQEVEPTPSPTIVTAVLLAIKHAAAVSYGKAMHAHIVKNGLISCISVVESLVDIYGTCNGRDTADSLLRLLQTQNYSCSVK